MFVNTETRIIQENIWDEIKDDGWKNFNFESYLYNYCLPPQSLHKQKHILNNILPVPEGTRYNQRTNNLEIEYYIPSFIKDTSISKYLQLTSDFLESLGAKKIGVHLSGGFDSSLIIATLTKLNIPIALIGLQGMTYEFRNERTVQRYFLERSIEGKLLNLEEYLFYNDFYNVPLSSYPAENIKSIASARAMAQEFKKLGCDVILSGQGGDSVFVEDMRNKSNIKFNICNEFKNDWETSSIYREYGLKLLSFYEYRPLIDYFVSIRMGEKEDPLKIFARKYFKSALPPILSEYCYVSDYFGYSKYGLHSAKKECQMVMDEAFELTHNHLFYQPDISNIDILGFEYNQYIRLCGILSAAIWVRDLNKKQK